MFLLALTLITLSVLICLGFISWFGPDVLEWWKQTVCPHQETIRKHDHFRTWTECLDCGATSPGIVTRIGKAMTRVCMFCKDRYGVKCYTCGSTELQERGVFLYFCLKCEVLVRVDPELETHGACPECHAVQMSHLRAEAAHVEAGEVRA